MKKIQLTFLLFILFITACSRLDLAVQFANTYVANKTDDYFDLTSEQSKWLKSAFDKDFAKVKKTIFPQMTTEMLRVAQEINDKKIIEEALVETSYLRMKNLLNDTARAFSGSAVLFAEKLTPNQIVYFQKEFDKKMKDIKEEDSQKTSYKKMKKNFDSWMGSVSSVQKKELENFTKKNPTPVNEIVYHRQMIAHEFVKAYPDKVSRKLFVEKLFTNYESFDDAAYAKVSKERQTKVVKMITTILNMMTPDQKKVLVDTIRERANQLVKISR